MIAQSPTYYCFGVGRLQPSFRQKPADNHKGNSYETVEVWAEAVELCTARARSKAYWLVRMRVYDLNRIRILAPEAEWAGRVVPCTWRRRMGRWP